MAMPIYEIDLDAPLELGTAINPGIVAAPEHNPIEVQPVKVSESLVPLSLLGHRRPPTAREDEPDITPAADCKPAASRRTSSALSRPSVVNTSRRSPPAVVPVVALSNLRVVSDDGYRKSLPPSPLSTSTATTQCTVRAMELLALGRCAEAEILFRQALSINEAIHGVGHIRTVTSVVDCSRLLQHQHKYAEANHLCSLELTRAENVLGADHPNIALLLSDLAGTVRKLGDHERALALLRHELRIRERGDNHIDLVRCSYLLGGALAALREYDEAIAAARQALSEAESHLGKEHYETVTALYYLATILLKTRNVEHRVEALPLLRRAFHGAHRRHPPHPFAAAIVKALQRELDSLGARGSVSTSSSAQRQSQRHGGMPTSGTDTPTKLSSILPTRLHSSTKPQAGNLQSSAPSSSFVRSASPPPFLSVGEDGDSEGDSELPEGWVRRHTLAGRPFYVHMEQRRTTWVHPRLNTHPEDMPEGWEQAIDEDGDVYYIDHRSKTTQRERPMPLGAKASRQGGAPAVPEPVLGPVRAPLATSGALTPPMTNSPAKSHGTISPKSDISDLLMHAEGGGQPSTQNGRGGSGDLVASDSDSDDKTGRQCNKSSSGSLASWESLASLLSSVSNLSISSLGSPYSATRSHRPTFAVEEEPQSGLLPSLHRIFWGSLRRGHTAVGEEQAVAALNDSVASV